MSIGTPIGPTTFSQEVAAVMADVTQDLGSVSVAIGRKDATVETAPPHVHWMPSTESPAPARQQPYAGGARSFVTRQMIVRIRCWGLDTDATDALWSSVLAALFRRYGSGSGFSFQGATWNTNDASVTELGESVTGTVVLPIALLDRAPTRVVITTAEINPQPITP